MSPGNLLDEPRFASLRAIDRLDHWLDSYLQAAIGAGPTLGFFLRLLFFLTLVLLSAWAGAPFCRWLSRRARRLGQTALAGVLQMLAPTVRLVLLFYGLYDLSDWVLAGRSGRSTLFTSLFYVALVVSLTSGVARAAQALLSAALTRLVGLEARLSGDEPVGTTSQSHRLVPLSQKLAMGALWLSALILVLDHFGQSVSSVLTALGVGSLAIGLASQQALSNMIAGLVLLIDKPFRIGDRIRLPGMDIGRVEDLGMRSTHIRLGDGNLLVVPNNDLVTSRVINYSGAVSTHGEVRLQVPAGTDLEKLGADLASAIGIEEGILDDPAPRLHLLSIGEKLELSLIFLLRPEADAPWVEERLRRLVLQRLQQQVAAPPA